MSSKSNKLPEHLEEKKKKVILKNEAPTNTRNLYYSGAYRQLGVDNSFNLEQFKKNFKIHVIECDDSKISFDLVGVDAPVANALRRILIAEIPTMAIEKVYIYNNTSIMQDEVLSHRLGLVPIKIDPREFEFKNRSRQGYTAAETIVFQLKVKCTKNPNPKGEDDKYINSVVRSGDLVWEPQEEQSELYQSIRPVHEDIILAKLRPGQEINLTAYCEKGIGKDHAKFSPVATATYRLLPEITFKKGKDIKDADAQELVDLCPMKVFDIEDLGNDHRRAVVSRPRNCTMCRECIRPKKYEDNVKLARIKDHFIFSVESTGILPAKVLFQEAVKELIAKCNTFETHLQKAARNELF